MAIASLTEAARDLDLSENSLRAFLASSDIPVTRSASDPPAETIDLGILRTAYRLHVLEDRNDTLIQTVAGLKDIADHKKSETRYVILALVATWLGTGTAFLLGLHSLNQSEEQRRALLATTGFAVIEQFVDGLERSVGPESRGTVSDLRLWMAALMHEENFISPKMWNSFMAELCPGSRPSDPAALKRECGKWRASMMSNGAAE